MIWRWYDDDMTMHVVGQNIYRYNNKTSSSGCRVVNSPPYFYKTNSLVKNLPNKCSPPTLPFFSPKKPPAGLSQRPCITFAQRHPCPWGPSWAWWARALRRACRCWYPPPRYSSEYRRRKCRENPHPISHLLPERGKEEVGFFLFLSRICSFSLIKPTEPVCPRSQWLGRARTSAPESRDTSPQWWTCLCPYHLTASTPRHALGLATTHPKSLRPRQRKKKTFGLDQFFWDFEIVVWKDLLQLLDKIVCRHKPLVSVIVLGFGQ